MWMSSLLKKSSMGLHPLIIVDVKSLLEKRIGLDPSMSAKCGCQVYLQHDNGFTPFDKCGCQVY